MRYLLMLLSELLAPRARTWGPLSRGWPSGGFGLTNLNSVLVTRLLQGCYLSVTNLQGTGVRKGTCQAGHQGAGHCTPRSLQLGPGGLAVGLRTSGGRLQRHGTERGAVLNVPPTHTSPVSASARAEAS